MEDCRRQIVKEHGEEVAKVVNTAMSVLMIAVLTGCKIHKTEPGEVLVALIKVIKMLDGLSDEEVSRRKERN